jgi:hypothetical protein
VLTAAWLVVEQGAAEVKAAPRLGAERVESDLEKPRDYLGFRVALTLGP